MVPYISVIFNYICVVKFRVLFGRKSETLITPPRQSASNANTIAQSNIVLFNHYENSK